LHIIETTAVILDNQMFHNDKDHQILFIGGPNTRKTNPRWWMASWPPS